MSQRRLIVEGKADKDFFSSFCRELGIKNLWVGPPNEFSQAGNGKGNALQALRDSLEDIRTGHVTNLGIIVDADYPQGGTKNGFSATRSEIKKIFEEFGYQLRNGDQTRGLFFDHDHGLPTLGAWIMPNNNDDGYLEKFCIDSAHQNESKLIDAARSAITQLKEKKFPINKTVKAEVATWLAWQKEPGQGLQSIIGGGLIDANSVPYGSIKHWLSTVFESKNK